MSNIEENPYKIITDSMKKAIGDPPVAFRIGQVITASPLAVACGKIILDDEIEGVIGQRPLKGDRVLLANIDDDQSFIIIGTIRTIHEIT